MLLRERVLVLRGFDAVLRGLAAELRGLAAELREVFAAPVVARFAVELLAGDLRAAPELPVLPRVGVDLPAVERVPLLRDVEPVEREDAAFVVRFADERVPDALRVLVLRPELPRELEDAELPPLLLLADPSIDHLPDITRCAASATASAMIEPSFVALDATALAA